MSDFFRNFPSVNYRFGDNEEPVPFQHLGTYIDILDQVKEYSVYYQNYNIQNGERPDQLSYKLYRTPDYYWTFWLLNDHLRQKGWPLRDYDVWIKTQEYYPHTTITTTAVTQDKDLQLVDVGGLDYQPIWIPAENKPKPLSQSEFFKVGNYVWFRYSKVAGEILKIDQNTGMITVDVKGVRNLDTVMEATSKEDALAVQENPDHEPATAYSELEIVKVYDEFDAPHHYEDASGNWVYPDYSSSYPYRMDQTSLNTMNSISNYQRITELNTAQKTISVIKQDVIGQIVSEFNDLLNQ
jgi:hypothetical protein